MVSLPPAPDSTTHGKMAIATCRNIFLALPAPSPPINGKEDGAGGGGLKKRSLKGMGVNRLPPSQIVVDSTLGRQHAVGLLAGLRSATAGQHKVFEELRVR